jgi:hypothetical protein
VDSDEELYCNCHLWREGKLEGFEEMGAEVSIVTAKFLNGI